MIDYTYEYPRPAVTVDGLIFNKSGEILLIRRAKEPYAGKWAFPGGFLEIDELLADGCRREIEEETCLKVGKLTQFRAYDGITRDPRDRTISIVFYGFAEDDTGLQGSDDAAEARWFSIEHLPPLAFDHDVIIGDFLEFRKLHIRK